MQWAIPLIPFTRSALLRNIRKVSEFQFNYIRDFLPLGLRAGIYRAYIRKNSFFMSGSGLYSGANYSIARMNTIRSRFKSDVFAEYLQSASCFRKVSVDNCGSHY